MTRDEAILLIQQRFQEYDGEEWWHPHNGETYLGLYDRLETYMAPEHAYAILSDAFWAAADEYGD
jgi:hypothetical protein